MFELANTSLPNGLIPGTHGFATVAMTKGLPDALRQRLEALCAYTHRQSAHDDRYFRENPVNWFHVALPTGEHAVGRVAACDFDYTGRTNRLARMLVFPAREMPRLGAVRVLSAEKARLSAPWDGEPRWLAPDAATATRLASSAAPVGATPSAWVAKFGAGGDTLAQRFALLLEDSVKNGGKPIYFKTSAASDPDGTGLLSLFSNLIDLLPPELCSAVTFSTYPDALPNGTRCHLRGAFDGDRAFAAASNSQPWVDCEHSRVAHEELLPAPKMPPKPVAPTPAASPRPMQPAAAHSEARAPAAPRAGAAQPRSQSYFPQPTQSKWLPPERKNSERNFYIALGSFVAAVLVAFGAVMWLMQKRQKHRDGIPSDVSSSDSDSSDIMQIEDDKKLELEENIAQQKRNEGEWDRAAEDALQKHQAGGAEGVAAEPSASQGAEAPASSNTSENALPEAAHEPTPQFDFGKATTLEVRSSFDDKAFIEAHQMMTTFYYTDGKCEVLEKGWEVRKDSFDDSTRYSNFEKVKSDCKGRFVIFYDPNKKMAFWLWRLPTDREMWFKSPDTKDLQSYIYGGEKFAFEFYEKHFGMPKYTVERQFNNEGIGHNNEKPQPHFIATQAMLSIMDFEPDAIRQQRENLENSVNEKKTAVSNAMTNLMIAEKNVESTNANAKNGAVRNVKDATQKERSALISATNALTTAQGRLNRLEESSNTGWKSTARESSYYIDKVEGSLKGEAAE